MTAVNDDTILNHVQTVRLPVPELARQLVAHLGATVVAALAGVRDRGLPHKWAVDGGVTPRPAALTRLQVAHRAWVTVATAEGEDIARAWFLGANPRLDETPPYLAIREGEFNKVMAAAVAFVDGTDA
ncbi:hypothetical protein [Mycobacteroides abscessus]|uniref:hypothetical protein n=1 Tax=Mycobacteroides abscessus TaxID=36809 RepID=UPI00092A0794|nr:hypothetical protein [Mycobacteroides abscessus]SIE11791.1 Uncharacterised protein [Mycobacteroides abscessus subsp. abscessus]SKU94627.1 Uncharacterised protein [Mycobacteroides abscessus subsp. bolletii]SLC71884.1 Uncharacterised protein [Mycobacteroides abscessus subsp. massiliense]SLJ49587.1 Uncharacterised protein [Mycobacteroides abscessus subsp. abscessus]